MQYSDLHLTVYITCNTLTFTSGAAVRRQGDRSLSWSLPGALFPASRQHDQEAAAAAASLDDAPEEAGYGTEDGRGVKQFVQLQAV